MMFGYVYFTDYSIVDVRLKDVTKTLGKKFSSGASVNETASGAKEVQLYEIL